MKKSIYFISEYLIPGSSKCDFNNYLEKVCEDRERIVEFLESVESHLSKKFGHEFGGAPNEEIFETLKTFQRKNFRSFNAFFIALTECYYLDPDIRARLGIPMKAPFPEGNFISELDLNLLEDVYNRGPVYRKS